jgi:hypothetical protein
MSVEMVVRPTSRTSMHGRRSSVRTGPFAVYRGVDDPALKAALERSGVTSAPSMATYSEADVTAY